QNKSTNQELQAQIDALSDYAGQLASEIELSQSKELIQKRIVEIERQIRDHIPVHRKWLQANTIPSFDIRIDSKVRQHLIDNSQLGTELKTLKGLLNGN